MPTEKEVLTGLLSTALQMDETGVAELYNSDGTELNENALQIILERDAQRIAANKPDTKKYFDDGYKKAQSETLSRFEKDVLSKYGIKSDKKGIELIEDIVNQYKQDNPDDPEKIKKSKYYLDAIEQLNKDKAEFERQKNEELEAFKKQVERERLFGSVSEQALVLLDNLKPILPTDAQKATNLKKVFLKELEGVNYEIREGQVVLLNSDNSDMTDAHGNRIKFDSFVKSTADKYFEFQASDSKGAPNHKQNNQSSTSFKINSQTDFINLMKTVKPEDKQALLLAYQEAKDAGRI